MATPAQTRFVAATSAGGAAAGLVLVAVRSGHAAACSAVGACPSGALLSVKPYVAAALIGLLLAALIAIAAVLTLRTAADMHQGERVSRSASRGRGVAMYPRARG